MPNITNQPRFSLAWISRFRWNVLDLIKIIGHGAIPTYMVSEIDMGWAQSIMSQQSSLGHKITVTSIILKAIAIAQKHHPESRTALLPWGRIVTFNQITAGFTVEKFIDGKPTVFFGSIQDPDTKSLDKIAKELRDYAERPLCDIPQLHLEDRFSRMPWLFRRLILWLSMRFPTIRLRCMNATFGVSSLGKYGVITLIPPCVCTSTFGVGKVEDRAVVRDGRIVIRPMMTLTLNFDHRLIDGAPAARFLEDIRNLIEGGLTEYISAPQLHSDFLPTL